MLKLICSFSWISIQVNVQQICFILFFFSLCFRYPDARAIQRKIIFHAGPTNSGKTYHAIQRFLSAKSGIYCGPLKLLAHEIFQKSNDAVSMSYYLPTSLVLEQSHECMSVKPCSGPRWALEPCAWAGAFALQWHQLLWNEVCISASRAEWNITFFKWNSAVLRACALQSSL